MAYSAGMAGWQGAKPGRPSRGRHMRFFPAGALPVVVVLGLHAAVSRVSAFVPATSSMRGEPKEFLGRYC